MADTDHYEMKTIHFPEANTDEERVTAVLITRGDDGAMKAYVKDFPDAEPPDPEAILMLKTSAEINNMPSQPGTHEQENQ